MSVKWLSEVLEDENHRSADKNFKSKEDFLELLNEITEFKIHESIDNYLDECENFENRQDEVIKNIQNTDPMHLTVACACGLVKSPKLETWKKVQLIQYHSWEVELWLKMAVSALIHKLDSKPSFLVQLADELCRALDKEQLKPLSERTNTNRKSALLNWGESKYKLDEIWSELKNSDFLDYYNEIKLFCFLNEFYPDECLKLLSNLSNPFLIDAALVDIGSGSWNGSFNTWQTYANKAPAAFNKDSSWNGSILLPLLLVNARSQLNYAGRNVPRNGVDEKEINQLNKKTEKIVKEIVSTLAKREDAFGIFSRWSTWLMRQFVTQSDELNDIRSSHYIDGLLLSAIGEEIKTKELVIVLSDDAAPWEKWCYFCVQGYWMNTKLIARKCSDEFYSAWKINPENWYSTEGQNLKLFAQLHISNNKIPNSSSYLLSEQLISQDNDIATNWKRLWDSSYTLREIVEFGLEDENGKKDYSDRSESSRLLLLLVNIGLACFDNNNSNPKASKLFNLLVSATLEMLHIDDTINNDKWNILLQQFSLRRAYLDVRYNSLAESSLFDSDAFSISDFLIYFNADSLELIKFLQVYLLNEWNIEHLKEDLSAMSIDLTKLENTAITLHKVRPLKYPFNQQGISLINNKLLRIDEVRT